jgi:hypothetical protein
MRQGRKSSLGPLTAGDPAISIAAYLWVIEMRILGIFSIIQKIRR